MTSSRIEIELNNTQEMFTNDKSAIVGMFGGLGNGKTFAGCLKAALRILDPEQPPQLGLLARQTYPELRDSTQRTFFEILHLFGLKRGVHFEYKKQENRVIFTNGHEVILRSLDDPAKLLSINLGWFYIDQAEEVTEEVYLTLLGRLRAVDSVQGWLTGNPLGHNWVWQRFIHNPIPGHKMYDAPTDENKDNLPEGYIESLEKNYNEIWVNRYLFGSWDAFEGQIYPDFDTNCHVVNDRSLPTEWTRIIAIDHGRTNPTAVLWGAIDNDDVLWIYREHYESGQDVDHHAKIINAYKGEGLSEVYLIDPSTGAGKKDDPETIGNRYRTLNVPVVNAWNDVQGGIDKVTHYIKSDKIKVMRSCVNFLREIINYQWEQPSAAKIDMNQPERPLKKDDHAMDSWRYMTAYAFDNVKSATPRVAEEKFIESIIIESEVEQQDWSEF